MGAGNRHAGDAISNSRQLRVLAIVDAFTREIKISMDGIGAWRDTVSVGGPWRSVKYEEVYLKAYESACAARASIRRYLEFYNGRRPHSSLDGRSPDRASVAPQPSA